MENALLKLLRVAILGPPNAGKSTLLNKLVYNEISCVSNKVHTTRQNTLGVYTNKDTQLEFYDSPGVVDKKHLLKHRIEDQLQRGPEIAALKCDLLAVMVDVSNPREQRRMNKGVLNLLNENPDKHSVLILNKVDLVKDKRSLLDISFALTEGHLYGRSTSEFRFGPQLDQRDCRDSKPQQATQSSMHKYVIELDQVKRPRISQDPTSGDGSKPENIGFRNFSQVFSISALNDEGVDEIRDHMLSLAMPVPRWPHGPDYLTNQTNQDLAHSIIRGRLMDSVDKAIPYLLDYKYSQFQYDDVGSLHIHLTIKCPEWYMAPKVIGKNGTVISRVSNEAREAIAKALGTEVKLIIQVDAPPRNHGQQKQGPEDQKNAIT